LVFLLSCVSKWLGRGILGDGGRGLQRQERPIFRQCRDDEPGLLRVFLEDQDVALCCLLGATLLLTFGFHILSRSLDILAPYKLEYVTSDHKVAGSSHAGCALYWIARHFLVLPISRASRRLRSISDRSRRSSPSCSIRSNPNSTASCPRRRRRSRSRDQPFVDDQDY
jgi:hypothetical protein